MLRKFASAQVLDAWRVPRSSTPRSLRKAAHRVTFNYTPRPGYLYVRSRAISSRTNDNHDTFPAEEIEKSYRSFLGKPVFVNHHNANHRRARGVIIAVALHRDRSPDGSPDVWAECLHEIDAQRFPKLAKAILAGRVNRTSMGVDCEYSTCSACGNRATSPAEYCSHMPSRKGMKIRQRGQDGKLREQLVHEICAGLTFFENSFLVEDPADPTAHVLDKPDARGLRMAASRTAALDDAEPDFRDHMGNTCIGCGDRVKWSRHPVKGGWKHYRPFGHDYRAHDHAAIPADPDDRSAVHAATFGGTHCLTCHEPVRINLDALYKPSGGWHHHDGMKRDHPAIPADSQAVYDAIPGQKARQQQAYQAMGDHLHRQFEQMSGHPLPRRPRGDEARMPPDPFTAGRRQAASFDRPLYHGTRSVLRPGEHLTADEAGRYSNYGETDHDYVHATTSPQEAHRWGGRASSAQAQERMEEMGRGLPAWGNSDDTYRPRVYRVHPTGPVEPDEEFDETEHDSYRSAHPMRVGEEVHPLSCYHPDHENEEHWPGHPHYDFLKAEQDERDDDEDEDGWGEHEGMRRHAITGEEAEPGHQIWAEPHGRSPVADELYHNMATREPEDWHQGLSYHGPYHMIRHPQTRSTHVVDAQGRDASPTGGGFGNHERDGSWGERQAEETWRTLEKAGPDSHRIGTDEEPRFSDLTKERTPGFPHSRIDPEDTERARRPDARVHEPEGHSPEDEWHGPYEVVKHPETGRFHIVDNAGRTAPNGAAGWNGHATQMRAERSRDYIDRRQQSKDNARGIADKLFSGIQDIFDPGGTAESRQSDRNMERGQELMGRYAGGKGHIKFDADDEGGAPYYEREHHLGNGKPSGWFAKHYGGPHMDIYHRATPDEAHDMIWAGKRDENDHLHPDYDDIDLGHDLKRWHDGDEEDEGGTTREYLEKNEPRIRRWKQQHRGSLQVRAMPRYDEPGDHPWFASHPGGARNLVSAWHDTSDDERAQGKRWYPDAHLVAKGIAGGDAATGAGLLAAYSPRTNWPANMFNAARSYHEGRAMGPGDGAVMGMHQRPAARILAGEHHSDVLRSPKVSAFAHLIEHGGQHGPDQRVVVDRHALSAWMGRRITDDDLDKSPVSIPRYYHHVEKDFISAARDLSQATGDHVTPEHLQAALWLRQVRRNADEDSLMRAASGGTGRVRSQHKDRERWEDFRKEHHPELPGADEMHHSAMRRTAADPPLRVPPSVDTLRPEACPVCGDQDVFKGQRCPVCGFVAPPDIFRDPDIQQAQQNRQMLEDGKVDSPMPEGPADEQIGSGTDAQDQMLHPDQIAPDGVPGAVQDPVAPGQGMLGEDGGLADPGQQPGGEDQLVFDENGQLIDDGSGAPGEGQPGEEPEPGPGGQPLPGDEGDEELADPDALDDVGEEAQEGEEEEDRGQELEDLGEQEQAQGEEEQDEAAAATGGAPMTQGGDQGDQALAGGIGGVPGDDGDGDEEGSPGKDQDDDDAPPKGKKMSKRTAATAVDHGQLRALAELRQQNAVLTAQLRFVAELAGIGPELEAIRRHADLANPASPVPDPPEGPPSETTEQALMPDAMGDPSRPGSEAGSLGGVPAQQTTTAITPGVEMQTAPATQLIDVTAPIQGTNPSQDGGVPVQQRRIETDVRIDPDPLKAQGPGIGGLGSDGTAFPWTLDARQADQQRQASRARLTPEDERAARTFAAIRLAKLQVQAGLVRGDELEVGTGIERDARLSLRDIEHEIDTLSRVARVSAAPPAQQRFPRGMIPRTASRTAPSLASSPQAPIMAMASAVQGDDDGDIFLD